MAAMATPYIPDTAWATMMAAPRSRQGAMQDFIPSAMPWVMVSAGPSSDACARRLVGSYSAEV